MFANVLSNRDRHHILNIDSISVIAPGKIIPIDKIGSDMLAGTSKFYFHGGNYYDQRSRSNELYHHGRYF